MRKYIAPTELQNNEWSDYLQATSGNGICDFESTHPLVGSDPKSGYALIVDTARVLGDVVDALR